MNKFSEDEVLRVDWCMTEHKLMHHEIGSSCDEDCRRSALRLSINFVIEERKDIEKIHAFNTLAYLEEIYGKESKTYLDELQRTREGGL